jgi:hypothetical protein
MTRTFGNQGSCTTCDPTFADRRLRLSLMTGMLMVIPLVFSVTRSLRRQIVLRAPRNKLPSSTSPAMLAIRRQIARLQ